MTPPAPCGVRILGVDETRARSVRWLLAEHGWRRSDPWMTSLVEVDRSHPGGLLGLAPGRSGASASGWLSQRSHAFRDGIDVVAVDPFAPFALRCAAGRAAARHAGRGPLASAPRGQPDGDPDPAARRAQQVPRPRGRKNNDSWAYRRLLMRGARHLSDKQWRRLRELFATDDPTGSSQGAWAGKELLRQLLDALPAVDGPLVIDPRHDPVAASQAAGPDLRPYEIRARLGRFYALAAQADVPELTRLAGTVETWWPATEASLRLRVTNARTEGYNRKISRSADQQIACGSLNQQSHERRTMLNNAATAA